MATTTPAIIEVLCVACDGETNKFVDDYEGHCEDCYTKKFHPKIWEEIQAERLWERRRLMDETLESVEIIEDSDSGSDDDAEEHKCGRCNEMFKVNDEGWYNGESWGRPICYDCYDEDECY